MERKPQKKMFFLNICGEKLKRFSHPQQLWVNESLSSIQVTVGCCTFFGFDVRVSDFFSSLFCSSRSGFELSSEFRSRPTKRRRHIDVSMEAAASSTTRRMPTIYWRFAAQRQLNVRMHETRITR